MCLKDGTRRRKEDEKMDGKAIKSPSVIAHGCAVIWHNLPSCHRPICVYPIYTCMYVYALLWCDGVCVAYLIVQEQGRKSHAGTWPELYLLVEFSRTWSPISRG